MVNSEQEQLDFSPSASPARERGDFSFTVGLGCDIQDHLDSVSGRKIGCEAAGLCKMGKNLTLFKRRAALPPNLAGPRLPMIFWNRVNGLCALQRGAGKGGNYSFHLCLSLMSALSLCHVGSKANVGVSTEVRRCSSGSKVGRICRNIVFCTAGTAGLYAGKKRLL